MTYCRAIAWDLDGTCATNGRLAPEVAAALEKARGHGIPNVLVTGRVHEEIRALCPDLSFVDAVVAENGAIVHLPRSGREVQLGFPPPDAFLG
jgi:hydroxymethylpyrimidine pyrophosphatase-like HAD family hydrolase